MAHIAQHYRYENTHGDDFDYPEPNYPYLYAPRSDAGYTTPAVSHAPLPPASVAPSHHSGTFSQPKAKRRVPERAYSDTSRSSGGDSYITPSLSQSQVGNRNRTTIYNHNYASPRSRATSFVSREDLRNIPNGPPSPPVAPFTPRSKPPTLVPSSSVLSHQWVPTNYSGSSISSPKPANPRRLRGVLKNPQPSNDDASYTSSSSAPDVIEGPPPPIIVPSANERTFSMVQPRIESGPSSELVIHRQSRAISTSSPSVAPQKTQFNGNSNQVSRHLSKPWDARSPPRLDSATRNTPAFDIPGVHSIQLIVAGLPWSIHVRAGASRSRSSKSRSRSRSEQITIGDVIDSVYASLNKSLTRTDVRAASNDTKKRIARAAAAAERESQRGEHSARTGKPSAARRIDFLGSRIWFLGLEKNDDFARREGYGLSEGELHKVWVMRFSSTPNGRATTVPV
ncbi:unnamed protein product [Rhizoctonia solani]|uniref:50S ribosomal protein L1 n=1 Tax=Rhizoctonia solani TaxID=456999 RepID=A0A8H3G816_9AGAM|nr:50S ribosomal protein L1 [Rhizoctonia solani]QRW24559.1 50S ribosomal protein L1 [Rhizoctonia solani]CAE6442975.1 unnamed protein product [Rhizoctonia solani]